MTFNVNAVIITQFSVSGRNTNMSRDPCRPDSECRALMYENPPRLDDDVLRQLLADARRSITASGEDAEFSMDVPPKGKWLNINTLFY
jgi:hypothetical protein